MVLILVVMIWGCGESPQDVVDEGAKSVHSWKKTLEMACREWAEDRVPTLYVKQTMKAAEEVLEKQLADLEKVKGNEGAQRAVRKIERLRYWIESSEKKLGEADGKKRREILEGIPGNEGLEARSWKPQGESENSYAPTGLILSRSSTHGLRRGLSSCAPMGLALVAAEGV
jgi:hypothetical protein